VTLPLVVLAYLNAFEKRSVKSGLWPRPRRRAGAETKYWVLTMIGAIGLAALIHPDRLKFLRSPAPWVAIATLVFVMIPHLVWLKQVDFVPLTYAGDVLRPVEPRAKRSACARLHRPQSSAARSTGGAGGDCAGMAFTMGHPGAAPVGLACPGMVAWRKSVRECIARRSTSGSSRSWSRSCPPLGGLIFTVYMKTDWGISLFFLTPLALVAIPSLRIQRIALFRIVAIWLTLALAALGRVALHRRGRDGTLPKRSRDLRRAHRSSPAN